MSLSTTDIYRLNHMNTAASKVDGGSGLGTFLSQLEGVTLVRVA